MFIRNKKIIRLYFIPSLTAVMTDIAFWKLDGSLLHSKLRNRSAIFE
jgi:hypothetical protein